MKALAGALALMIAAVSAAPAAAQTTVGPGLDGNTFSPRFGAFPNGTPNFGQTLLSPGGTLTDFSFGETVVQIGGNVQFVFAPVTGTTPGTPLFTSSPFALLSGTNTISGINAATTAGQSYIGYLTTYQVANPVSQAFLGIYSGGASYTGGNSAFLSSAADPTGSAFTPRTDDLAFTATFAPAVAAVPEPATWGLMILGFGAVGGVLRRRRTRPVAFATV
ncbi:MAG: PEPxxWA-CTERM sorting domain-containing protein [Pseudomonadota bacterium]